MHSIILFILKGIIHNNIQRTILSEAWFTEVTSYC